MRRKRAAGWRRRKSRECIAFQSLYSQDAARDRWKEYISSRTRQATKEWKVERETRKAKVAKVGMSDWRRKRCSLVCQRTANVEETEKQAGLAQSERRNEPALVLFFARSSRNLSVRSRRALTAARMASHR